MDIEVSVNWVLEFILSNYRGSTSHSAYVATDIESNGAKIDGF